MTNEEIEAKLAQLSEDVRTLAGAMITIGDTLEANQKTISYLMEQLAQRSKE